MRGRAATHVTQKSKPAWKRAGFRKGLRPLVRLAITGVGGAQLCAPTGRPGATGRSPLQDRGFGVGYRNSAFTRPSEAGATAGLTHLKYWMRWFCSSAT